MWPLKTPRHWSHRLAITSKCFDIHSLAINNLFKFHWSSSRLKQMQSSIDFLRCSLRCFSSIAIVAAIHFYRKQNLTSSGCLCNYVACNIFHRIISRIAISYAERTTQSKVIKRQEKAFPVFKNGNVLDCDFNLCSPLNRSSIIQMLVLLWFTFIAEQLRTIEINYNMFGKSVVSS